MMNNASILLVDDDNTIISALRLMLKDLGQLRFATTGKDALRLARWSIPDIILLDVSLPDMNGFEVCLAIKADPLLSDVPVIFITSHDDIEQEVNGFKVGAVDFIAKPPREPLVRARVNTHLRMKQMADELRLAANVDALTGVANRRHFDEMLNREWLRARRAGTPLSLLMIDVDYFKKYNDCYGHLIGDQCLKSVAQALKQAARRETDLIARYGGEEFAILLPESDAQVARTIAEETLHIIRDLAITHAGSTISNHVTLSIGISSYDSSNSGWVGSPVDSRAGISINSRPSKDLVAAADQALYAAKNEGRNRARFLSLDEAETSLKSIKENAVLSDEKNFR